MLTAGGGEGGEGVVRPMTAADLEAVVALERRIYPFPWSELNFTDSMRAGVTLVVMELEQAQLAGYGVLQSRGGESELLNIAIAPEYQQRGLGRQLLQWMIFQASQQGAESIFLEVRRSNLGAQRLYESEGFNEIGERRGYYPDHGGKREDALLYGLALPKDPLF